MWLLGPGSEYLSLGLRSLGYRARVLNSGLKVLGPAGFLVWFFGVFPRARSR